MKKRSYNTWILAVLFLMTGCYGGGGDGYYSDPCGWNSGNYKHEHTRAALGAEGKAFISGAKKQFEMINSGGFKATFVMDTKDTFTTRSELVLSQFTKSEYNSTCSRSTTTQYYCAADRKAINYTSGAISLKLSLVSTKALTVLPQDMNDKTYAAKLPDVNYIGINTTSFPLLDVQTPDILVSELDSMMIIDTVYRQVIHSRYSPAYLSRKPGVYPSGAYYKKGHGFVGFHMSNGEMWRVK